MTQGLANIINRRDLLQFTVWILRRNKKCKKCNKPENSREFPPYYSLPPLDSGYTVLQIDVQA
jgi:hypothetical protein